MIVMNTRPYRLMTAAVVCTLALASGASLAQTPPQAKNASPKPGSVTVQVTGLKDREAAAELAGLLSGIQTLSARFEQQTLDDSGKRLQESRGDMLLKRPNLFRWNVVEPFPQEVVSDGTKVSYYDKDLDQLTLQNIDTRTSATPALLLSGDAKKVLERFTVNLSRFEKNSLFTLLPKGSDSAFQELKLRFIGKTLEEMVLIDTLGSRTRVIFSDTKINVPVKAGSFKLEMPPGIDVIDQTTAAPAGDSGKQQKKK